MNELLLHSSIMSGVLPKPSRHVKCGQTPVKLRSRASLPAIPTISSRHLRSWPSTHQANRRSVNLNFDECAPAISDVSCEEFYARLGEREAPEGREDFECRPPSEYFETLPESGLQKSFVHSKPPRLKLFVRERLERKIRVALPLPSPVEFTSTPERNCFREEETIPSIETKCEAFQSWLDGETCFEPIVQFSGLKLGEIEVGWAEVDRIIVNDCQKICLETPASYHSFVIPKFSDCLSTISKMAKRTNCPVVQQRTKEFCCTMKVQVTAPASRCEEKQITREAFWKSLQSPKHGWRKGFLEVTEASIYLSESLHKTPELVLPHPRTADDVRIVDLDAKIASDLPENQRRVVRLGLEVFVAVDRPDTLCELLQDNCSTRDSIRDLLAEKTIRCEVRCTVKLELEGLRMRMEDDLRIDFRFVTGMCVMRNSQRCHLDHCIVMESFEADGSMP
ncbi:unnamed protein product [Notodromas monacha]|uniref:Uncharacterized protein n=1 Tax=Notodromas monacha TaxID=399045 RepID=A0A7R9BLQ1_9CRUS|nr:unnamed protein product [Notodromas monacha]CAG0916482.1 unnamed protein product [Notodromas monacha]